MPAGRYRRVLQYQVSTPTRDAMNQLVPSWSIVSTHRGEVRAPRGTEATVSLQVLAFVSLIIECRFPGYTFDVKGKIVDVTDPANPLTYNVVASTDFDGRRRKLITYATQVASAVSTNNSNQ